MKLRYTAHSLADSDDTLVNAELTVPDDAGHLAVIGALVNAVEQRAVAESGSQTRVIAWRGQDPDPFIWHSWDHA